MNKSNVRMHVKKEFIMKKVALLLLAVSSLAVIPGCCGWCSKKEKCDKTEERCNKKNKRMKNEERESKRNNNM